MRVLILVLVILLPGISAAEDSIVPEAENDWENNLSIADALPEDHFTQVDAAAEPAQKKAAATELVAKKKKAKEAAAKKKEAANKKAKKQKKQQTKGGNLKVQSCRNTDTNHVLQCVDAHQYLRDGHLGPNGGESEEDLKHCNAWKGARGKWVQDYEKSCSDAAHIIPAGFECGSANTGSPGWSKATCVATAAGATIQSYARKCSANLKCAGFNIDTHDMRIPCWFKKAARSPNPTSGLSARWLQCKKLKVKSCRNAIASYPLQCVDSEFYLRQGKLTPGRGEIQKMLEQCRTWPEEGGHWRPDYHHRCGTKAQRARFHTVNLHSSSDASKGLVVAKGQPQHRHRGPQSAAAAAAQSSVQSVGPESAAVGDELRANYVCTCPTVNGKKNNCHDALDEQLHRGKYNVPSKPGDAHSCYAACKWISRWTGDRICCQWNKRGDYSIPGAGKCMAFRSVEGCLPLIGKFGYPPPLLANYASAMIGEVGLLRGHECACPTINGLRNDCTKGIGSFTGAYNVPSKPTVQGSCYSACHAISRKIGQRICCQWYKHGDYKHAQAGKCMAFVALKGRMPIIASAVKPQMEHYAAALVGQPSLPAGYTCSCPTINGVKGDCGKGSGRGAGAFNLPSKPSNAANCYSSCSAISRQRGEKICCQWYDRGNYLQAKAGKCVAYRAVKGHLPLIGKFAAKAELAHFAAAMVGRHGLHSGHSCDCPKVSMGAGVKKRHCGGGRGAFNVPSKPNSARECYNACTTIARLSGQTICCQWYNRGDYAQPGGGKCMAFRSVSGRPPQIGKIGTAAKLAHYAAAMVSAPAHSKGMANKTYTKMENRQCEHHHHWTGTGSGRYDLIRHAGGAEACKQRCAEGVMDCKDHCPVGRLALRQERTDCDAMAVTKDGSTCFIYTGCRFVPQRRSWGVAYYAARPVASKPGAPKPASHIHYHHYLASGTAKHHGMPYHMGSGMAKHHGMPHHMGSGMAKHHGMPHHHVGSGTAKHHGMTHHMGSGMAKHHGMPHHMGSGMARHHGMPYDISLPTNIEPAHSMHGASSQHMPHAHKTAVRKYVKKLFSDANVVRDYAKKHIHPHGGIHRRQGTPPKVTRAEQKYLKKLVLAHAQEVMHADHGKARPRVLRGHRTLAWELKQGPVSNKAKTVRTAPHHAEKTKSTHDRRTMRGRNEASRRDSRDADATIQEVKKLASKEARAVVQRDTGSWFSL